MTTGAIWLVTGADAPLAIDAAEARGRAAVASACVAVAVGWLSAEADEPIVPAAVAAT